MARLVADLGFLRHAHLTRNVRSESPEVPLGRPVGQVPVRRCHGSAPTRSTSSPEKLRGVGLAVEHGTDDPAALHEPVVRDGRPRKVQVCRHRVNPDTCTLNMTGRHTISIRSFAGTETGFEFTTTPL